MKGKAKGNIEKGQLIIRNKWGFISLDRPGMGKGKLKVQPGGQFRGDDDRGSGPEVLKGVFGPEISHSEDIDPK